MSEQFLRRLSRLGVDNFLARQPDLRLLPDRGGKVRIAGTFRLAAIAKDKERIDDEFELEFLVPHEFPRAMMTVRETAGRIPASFHTNPDRTLCLGSPTRLRLIANQVGSILGFIDGAVVPFLYGFVYYQRHHIMPFDELAHGGPGLLTDFAMLFGVNGAQAVDEFLFLTGLTKRVANKYPCPCGSGKRLGVCHHLNVNRLRGELGRHWFASHRIDGEH
ncbi:MAG: SEC-C domain-containing protein [Gemmatimonadales bacterium]|nr:SEC-C domain-containing protein [Gemmatimonadales bacterium]